MHFVHSTTFSMHNKCILDWTVNMYAQNSESAQKQKDISSISQSITVCVLFSPLHYILSHRLSFAFLLITCELIGLHPSVMHKSVVLVKKASNVLITSAVKYLTCRLVTSSVNWQNLHFGLVTWRELFF